MAFVGGVAELCRGAERRRCVCSAVQDRSNESSSDRRKFLQLSIMTTLGAAVAGLRVEEAAALNKNKRLKMGPPVELENGVVYKEIKVGEGIEPSFGDTVTIHYSLFCDGIEVETSRDSQGLAARPLGFTWGTERGPGSIIKGVPMGMEGMKVGGQRYISVPPELAFGPKGRPPLIPPNSPVDFAVSLLSVKRQGSNPNVSSRKTSVY